MRPHAAGQRQDLLQRAVLVHANRLLDAAQTLGHGEALRIGGKTGHDDHTAVGVCHLRGQLGHDAGAGHQHIIAGVNRGAFADGAHHTSQRFAQGGRLQGNALRQAERVAGRQNDVLGKAAVDAAAHALALRAQHTQALTAPFALLTGLDGRQRHNAVTHLEIGDILAHLRHYTGKLVAGDDGRVAGIGIVHQVNVRTADAAGVDLLLDVMIAGDRLRNVHILHTVGAELRFYQRFHVRNLRFQIRFSDSDIMRRGARDAAGQLMRQSPERP